MTTNAVRQVLEDLGAGRITMAEAIAELDRALVPARRYPPAADTAETYRREQADVIPPWTPGSADEIDLAAVDGTLTPEQALALRSGITVPKAEVVELDLS